MGNVTIRFKYNRKTGKKEMTIELEEDPEKLQFEHERDHRKIVKEIVGDAEVERIQHQQLETLKIEEENQEREALSE